MRLRIRVIDDVFLYTVDTTMGTFCQSISNVEQTWPVQFPGITAAFAAAQRPGDHVEGKPNRSESDNRNSIHLLLSVPAIGSATVGR